MTTDAVEVPFCRVCRRSSELKWCKHVFSKSHQRAAAELLATWVAKIADARAQISDASEPLRSATEPKRQWVDHYASRGHREKLNAFCQHHRCDADQKIRPQLCLTQRDAQQLTNALDNVESAAQMLQATNTTGDPSPPTTSSPPPSGFRGAHAQAFLESATTRLRQVTTIRAESVSVATENPLAASEKVSWMGPHANSFTRARTVASETGILQNPLGRHEGRRVWGGGVVKLRKAEWIPWGIDLAVVMEEGRGLGDVTGTVQETMDESDTIRDQRTDMALSTGLSRIKRIEWGTEVANIHSEAVPPWLVDTEEEYWQCNKRTAGSSTVSIRTKTTQHDTRTDSSSTIGGIDIFSKLETKYDEKTWLPNFGSVWQEGSRLQSRKEFRKTQERGLGRKVQAMTSQVDFKPLRNTQQLQSLAAADTKIDRLTLPPEQRILPTVPSVQTELVAPCSVAAPDPDAKKALLLAQKERLRAKLALRRQAST